MPAPAIRRPSKSRLRNNITVLNNDLPAILIIDDKDDIAADFRLWEQLKLAKITVLHPEEVEQQDIDTADLVLVDYDIWPWPEHPGMDLPIGQTPRDGLALAAVLRRFARTNQDQSPTAFAILTGQIDALAKPLPPENRNHALARINNLEWIFEKGHSSRQIQISGLANAVKKLPQDWFPDRDGHSMNQLMELLGIDPSAEDRVVLADDVARCLPPVHELSQWSHGLALLRWFLHRILPYPCFLFDTHYLAARLRIEVQALQEALKPGQPLSVALESCKYTGILADFMGDRWWRSKVELLLWEETGRKSFDRSAVNALVSQMANSELPTSIPANNPVVCLDRHYQPLDQFASIEDAVRIRPDDWPAFADQAWTTVARAKDEPTLKSVVVEDDKEKLN